jgi:hypothetical protein
MIGSTSPSGSWTIDTVMETTDNITYTLNNVTLTTATDPATTGLKFRQDGQWTTNWGNSNFPSGTATLNGPNIMTVAGTYNVTFNRINGTYTFISTSYPIIGIWDQQLIRKMDTQVMISKCKLLMVSFTHLVIFISVAEMPILDKITMVC